MGQSSMTKAACAKKYRDIYVAHEGAKLKLAIYDLAEAAGLTRQELTCILAEELHDRITYDTWASNQRKVSDAKQQQKRNEMRKAK